MGSMPTPDVLIPARDLTVLATQLLDAVGVASGKSKLVAESLVAANLRGVDSHGVQLLPYYLEQLEWGDMDAQAEGKNEFALGKIAGTAAQHLPLVFARVLDANHRANAVAVG